MEQIDKGHALKEKQLELQAKRLTMIEMSLAYVMGIFGGFGLFIAWKEISKALMELFVKLFAK